ncbi:beta-glucuronidase-like [Saccostrea echinata]|uniref:beta-glucuronidase-like n=1 Tax=Saccostrea echinata TaxID=191078 RepID=UPI002A80412F|nr:beta-glucuronidase-like [Saccostrea echinata]
MDTPTIQAFFICLQICCAMTGMLYPRYSVSRTFIQNIDGLWNFRIDTSESRVRGFDENWFSRPLKQSGPVIPMPVPASYNDITQSKKLRDFVGWAWYDNEFYIPPEFTSKRIVLRIDSAHYNTIVWVNGQEVMQHSGGHLPFETELKNYNTNGPNRMTVAINNTLTPTTLPPGTIEYKNDPIKYPKGYFVQNLQMDFFNYAGIHRSVKVYTTPKVYVDDITIVTDIHGSNGVVSYTVSPNIASMVQSIQVTILDKEGNSVGQSSQPVGQITVHNAKFWWPYTMVNSSNDAAYLYTFKVTLTSTSADIDQYSLPFGIRTVSNTNTQLLINNKPFYCHGVAKHEDSDIRGKGLDYPLIAKDFNLLKWLGANCFRTSHYPYAEEIMDQADQQGIVVIDESPGVGIEQNNFGNESLVHHLNVMDEMIQRDKNRPAVIIWSIANEPKTGLPASEYYFKTILQHVKKSDPTRLVTFVANADYDEEKVAQYNDILCINRYYAWYSDCSHTELINLQLTNDLKAFHNKYNKPIIVTEYGADTIPGYHQDPSFVFTEEFQVEFLQEYHKVFDSLRQEFLVGEMPWNFADFMTIQQIIRVVGNKKGLFTRQRQPKMSAHLIRSRYFNLMQTNTTHHSNIHGHSSVTPKPFLPIIFPVG